MHFLVAISPSLPPSLFLSLSSDSYAEELNHRMMMNRLRPGTPQTLKVIEGRSLFINSTQTQCLSLRIIQFSSREISSKTDVVVSPC